MTALDFYRRVYLWMFLGLTCSGLVAFLVSQHKAFVYHLNTSPWLVFLIFIVQLILVSNLASRQFSLSLPSALFGYFGYASLNGLLLSAVFMFYDTTAIATAFGVSALMFLVMSVIGSRLQGDMAKMGNILIMALIGILIALFVNIFIGSDRFETILSVVMVVVFAMLVAYDTQNLKRVYAYAKERGLAVESAAVSGALSLYLSFINIFLTLLRFFGR